MKGISLLVVLFVVAGSELARASENYADDGYDQLPMTRTLLRKTKRPRSTKTTTTKYYTDETKNTETHVTEPSVTTEHDDKSTTSTTPSTTAGTTSSIPPTSPTPRCNESEFTVDDLTDLIKFTMKDLKVLESIKTSYHDDAMNVLDTHEKTLNRFLEWFNNQPTHLKHILEDLSQTRQRIQLNITEINKKLEEGISLENFKKIQLEVADLEEQTKKTKTYCEISCQLTPLSRSFTYEVVEEEEAEEVPPTKLHYCGKLADIYVKIRASWKEFVNDTQKSLRTLIKDDNVTYVQEIDALQNMLKDLALKEFGRTMYDILNLIDGYHHLEKKTNFGEIHDMVYQITKNINNITNYLWKLKDSQNQIYKKCRQCKNYFALGSQFVQKQSGHKDLLEELLDNHKNETKQIIMDEYNSIFEALKEELNLDHPDKFNQYIENLKPIQNEVTAMTKAEHERLMKVLNDFPSEKLYNFEFIEKEAENLLKSLESIEKKLHDIERMLRN